MITYHTAYMNFYTLGMIEYHALYMCSNKVCMITYNIFSDRLIFITRGFHSEYNFLINHNIYIFYETGYKKNESEFRFSLLWVTVILSFHWHCEPCYFHNTDLGKYTFIYRTFSS